MDKAIFVISVSLDNVARGVSAKAIAKEVGKMLGGGGGGTDERAEGSGPNVVMLDKALGAVPSIVERMLHV